MLFEMLLGTGAALVTAAISSVEDDDKTSNQMRISQQNYEQQRQLEEMRIKEKKRQDRHETAGQIIGGAISLLSILAQSSNSNNGNSGNH